MTSVDVGKPTTSSDDYHSTYIGDSHSTYTCDATSANNADDSIALSTKRSSNFSKRDEDSIIIEGKSAILAPSKDRGKNKTVDDFTVNKLRYSSLGLHGREKEKEILNTCLENVAAKDNNIKRALVLIPARPHLPIP
jgi:hypothetical protein